MTEEMTWKGEKIVITPDAFAGIVHYAKDFNQRVGQFIQCAVDADQGADVFNITDADLLYACAKYYYTHKNAQATATPTKPA